ncbi:MAG: DegV family protein [Clostridiales bacterium]|nr:DegV family protein [Clostridiales bacterium]
MKIRITSDSTCDLNELVTTRDIGILPFQVNLGDNAYRDGVDITPQDIFNFVSETKILPKTAAPSIGEYEEFFEKELNGYDELIHFNISAQASGSHNFAKEAANSFGGKVRVIDSKALSSGQGLLVLKAADMRDAGKSGEEIEKEICVLRDRVNTSFVPDTLDYLHKGGRCSSMKMLAANILKIHPKIVMVDGKLQQGGTYKGSIERCISKYIEELAATYGSYDTTRCFVTHSSADKEVVDMAKAKVAELFHFDEIIETVAGSIITSHCGKGTLGVLFIYNK